MTYNTENLAPLIDPVCDIALRAGEEIMEVYRSHKPDIKYKADKSPVTRADLAADQLIRKELKQLTPEWPILSEEHTKGLDFETRSAWSTYWLVDPLDGTKGFIKQNGFFTVNIALIDNHQPVLGVIFAPSDEHLYYARRGGGAYKQIKNELAQKISVRKIPRNKPVVVASRAHINKPTQMLIDALDAEEIRVDSSLKCCMVADGSADLYLRSGPTSEWDTGAGQCIVEEAGGQLTDCSGSPLEYNHKESYLNPSFVVHCPASPPWKKYVEELLKKTPV